MTERVLAENESRKRKLEAIKKHFKEIPTKFVSEAHIVLDRGTTSHRVWDFEKWFDEANEILEATG